MTLSSKLTKPVILGIANDQQKEIKDLQSQQRILFIIAGGLLILNLLWLINTYPLTEPNHG